MKLANRNISILFAVPVLLFVITQQTKASEYAVDLIYSPYHLTQNHEDWRQFELAVSQA